MPIYFFLFMLLAMAVSPASLHAQRMSDLPASSGSKPATSAPAAVQKFGAWQLECAKTNKAAKKLCMLRIVGKDPETQKRIFAIAIIHRPDGRRIMRMAMPLGVHLMAPNHLTVDTNKTWKWRLPITHCLPDGCHVVMPWDEKIEQAFKKGVEGKITVLMFTKRAVNMPFPLKGFSKGMQALNKAIR
ncbi:invasion associated locus B family protein [Magnetococcus sp. PR-3]|uniref:invasion associated locus B family protein n=1 Tax=Magnetococcus sp. PR-3 TaxID=3120355 RepID=UPI002FCE2DD8